MEHQKSTIEEQLATYGVYYATTEGDSMAPLFRTHEKVVRFQPKTGRLKKWDIPLVRREDGHCVMHRIVKVMEDGYLTRGDNRRKNDPPVKEEEVIGVMDGYYKGDTFVPLDAPSYRAYLFFWGRPNPIRWAWLLWRGAMRRIKRRLRRKR